MAGVNIVSGTNLVYYGLLALIVGLGLWLGRDRLRRVQTGIYVAAVTVAMILIVGLRYGIGFDYVNYLSIFEYLYPLEWSQFNTYIYEWGFGALSKVVMDLIPSAALPVTQIYMFYAIVMMCIVGYVVWRRSEIPWLSLFVFVTLSYMASSMNFLRQTIAAFIFLLAIPYLQNKKIVPYMLLVLLASTMHKSALVLIVVYFIANLPLNRITGILYGVGTLIAFLFSDLIMGFLLKYIYTGYSGGSEFYQGSSLAFVLVPLLLAVLTLLRQKQLLKLDKRNIVYVNLMVYGGFFELMMVRHFIVERMALFFMVPLILIVPLLVRTFEPTAEPVKSDGVFRSEKAQIAYEKKQLKERRQIYYSIVLAICLSCFFHFVMGTNYGFHKVYPYYSVFSQEAQEGAFIPEKSYAARSAPDTQPNEE